MRLRTAAADKFGAYDYVSMSTLLRACIAYANDNMDDWASMLFLEAQYHDDNDT